MKLLKKVLLLFLCFLMGITGPVLSSALADGYGNTAASGSEFSAGGNGGAPCVCCKNLSDQTSGSSNRRAFFYNGSEYLQKFDLALPGIMPIIFQRTYNNQATFDSPLGYGWDFSFNDRLRTYSDNSVVIRTTTGKKLHFIFTGGIYVCEESPHVTLENNPDGSFVFYASPVSVRYHYDLEGRLFLLQNINGESLRMSYSSDPEPLIGTLPSSIAPDSPMVVSYNFQLQRIEQFDSLDSSTGRYIDFTYNGSSGRLVSIADSTGRTISYQHDSLGNLTRIDYPEGLFIAYEYTDPNDSHNMTNNLRGYGANAAVLQTARQYDVDDRMVREEYAGGALEIAYTIPLQKTKVTRTVVDSQDTVLHTTETFYEFNTAGYLIQTTDSDSSTKLVRDSRNNIIKRILYTNNGSASSPNLELKVSTENIFDTENNKTESSTALENGEELIHKFSYNDGVVVEQQTYSTARPDRVHQTILEYNYQDSIPTTVAMAKTLRSSYPVPSYDTIFLQYNTENQLEEILYDNGDTITMVYNNGLLIQNEDILFTHDNRGNVLSIEDANGHITQYEYDNLDRNTKIINSIGEETLLNYTGWDLTRIEQGKTAGQSGRITDFVYDEYGHILQAFTDLAGAPVLQETYTYDSDGNLLSVTDQLNRTETASYNPWGRLLSHTDAANNTTIYTYSPFGELVSVTSPLGQTTTVEYDVLGRRTKVTAPLSAVVSSVYDELGNITQITDAESRDFFFSYDLAGQMISRKTPASAATRYEHDSRGRISQVILPDGTTNLYEYNSRNQIQKVILATGTADSSTLRYGYDKTDNMLWYSDSAVAMEPLFNMTYDALDRLKTKTITPINKTLQFTYTPQGQRQDLTVLDGSTTELFNYSYVYDTAGRLTSHTEQQQSVSRTIGFSFDNSGLFTGKTYSNGITASLGYTDSGLLTNLHYRKSDSTTIEHFLYAYDGDGRLVEITNNQGKTSFTYDLLNRLTVADYPADSSLEDDIFTYDLTENRLTSTGISDWTYDSSGKLNSYNGHILTYDAHGRQKAVAAATETVTYQYDNLDRLIKAQKTGMLADYNYGYYNRRVKKTVNTTTTWYLYDGANILAEFDQSGQLTRNYSYTPGTFDLLGVTEGTDFQTVLTNHLQTPQYVFDGDQSVLWQAVYQSYGKPLINDDIDGNGIAVTLNQRFPGQYADSETGLSYNWHRSYNPETGRYISPDPIGINGGVNLFGYAGGSPQDNVDPLGLVCEDIKTIATFAEAVDYANAEYDKNNKFKNWKEKKDMGFTHCQDLAYYAMGGKPTGNTDKKMLYNYMVADTKGGYKEIKTKDNVPSNKELEDGDIVLLGMNQLEPSEGADHYVVVVGHGDDKRILQIQRFDKGGHLDIQEDLNAFSRVRRIQFPAKWYKERWYEKTKGWQYGYGKSPKIYKHYRVFRRNKP